MRGIEKVPHVSLGQVEEQGDETLRGRLASGPRAGHEVHGPLPERQEALRDVRKASKKVQTMSTLGSINYQPNMVSDSEGWAALAARIRRTGGCLFWELFSGVAVLTQAFVNEGWDVGPPIDGPKGQ